MKTYFLLLSVLFIGSCAYYFEPDFDLTNQTRIYQVIDGDTFIITGGEYVRLIGIDAPERKEEGYQEATDFLRQFEGQEVFLEIEGNNRDRFGRLLRHAYVKNQSLAFLLLQQNHATTYKHYSGTYSEKFKALK